MVICDIPVCPCTLDDGWDIMYTNKYITSLQMPMIEVHRPGIEPGPPAWQAGTLPNELSTL